MKTIGLIGGLTWHSTLEYYRVINREVNNRLGGAHSAKIILNSVDFEEVKAPTEKEDWTGIAGIICKAALVTEAAGADCLVIAANTMHNIADKVSAVINIPLIHIAEATATAISKRSLKTVALLGTKYTMMMDFYKDKLAEQGINTIIPSATDIEYINNSIYTEFDNGVFLSETKQQYLRIIDRLKGQGAEGVILGCTEIPILVKQEDCSIPVFDTGLIHALAAVEYALG